MTLIEVLVAVSLLGLLSVGIFTALQVAAGSWQSARGGLMLDRRVAGANSILHAEFSSIVPAEAEIAREREIGIQRLLFFQGEPESMRFVSAYSVTEGRRGGLQIVELSIVDGRRGRRILLNQIPYQGPFSAGIFVDGFVREPGRPRGRVLFRPIRAMPTSLIIADELRECRFAYLKKAVRPDEPAIWLPVWDDLNRLPEAISVRLVPRRDPARLLPETIITPIQAKNRPRRALP